VAAQIDVIGYLFFTQLKRQTPLPDYKGAVSQITDYLNIVGNQNY
jgi:hypothetical protein